MECLNMTSEREKGSWSGLMVVLLMEFGKEIKDHLE